jgi:hypothetical protein
MDDDAEQCAGPDLTVCHWIGDLHGYCAVAYCGRKLRANPRRLTH